MPTTLEPLIRDFVAWVAKEPRPYSEALEAWRTSCPRLTVWEDAADRGFVQRERLLGGGVVIAATPKGRKLLEGSDLGIVPADQPDE
jgi:hypothetical protein